MIDYNQLLGLLRTRRSIRRFTERAVSRELVEALIEAAQWAPSGHNRQPWRFVVLENPERIQRLAEAVRAELQAKLKALPTVATGWADEFVPYATLFERAPVVIVVLHKKPPLFANQLLASVPLPELVSGEPLSAAMAVQNFLLAAHAHGLGTCVMTAPLLAPAALSEALSPPPGHDFTCLVALGWPAESPDPPRRKSLEHIVQYADSPNTLHDDRSRNL